MSDRLEIQQDLLPYAQNLALRALGDVTLVVMHCTELPDLATARIFGERIHYAQSRTGNSGHFYIDVDGSVHQWVPLDRVAHHTRNYNSHSIGIELVNIGRYPDWLHSERQQMVTPYSTAQMDALLAVLAHLRARVPSLAHIAGHEDLDPECVPAEDNPAVQVRRKLDPGPQFPWARVLEAGGLRRL